MFIQTARCAVFFYFIFLSYTKGFFMTQQEKYVIYDILMRLVDNDQVLTPLERRDMMRQVFYQVCKINIDDFLGASRGQRALRPARGNAARNDAYVGQNGEITVDTENKTLRVHDGETPGGVTIARTADIPDIAGADYVIEWQTPTAENNYTWYRKYKSGWVEMGGHSTSQTVTFPVEMADTSYEIQLTGSCSSNNNNVTVHGWRDPTTTGFTTQGNVLNNKSETSGSNASAKRWYVCGMSA